MIFWNGEEIFRLIRDAALIEGAYFSYQKGRFNKNIRKLGGRLFILKFATVFRSEILIYKHQRLEKFKILERIPIVSEYEKLENFPDRFAIKTKNIDLLRELIAMGKEVCWFDPDLYTQAHFLGILNFYHVFVNPNIRDIIIYPTGEVRPAKEAIWSNGKYGYTVKYSKKIGFNMRDVKSRIDWVGYSYALKQQGRSYTFGKITTIGVAIIYNIFSVTYMIWRQSKPQSAMTATKKIANKE